MNWKTFLKLEKVWNKNVLIPTLILLLFELWKVSEEINFLGHLKRCISLVYLSLGRSGEVELRRYRRVKRHGVKARCEKRPASFR